MGCSGCLWILLDKLAVLFFPFSLLNWAGKRAVPVTTTVTLIVCVLLTSQLSGHRKSKRQEKEKKEREKTDQKRIKIGIHIPNKGRKGEKEKEQDQEK